MEDSRFKIALLPHLRRASLNLQQYDTPFLLKTKHNKNLNITTSINATKQNKTAPCEENEDKQKLTCRDSSFWWHKVKDIVSIEVLCTWNWRRKRKHYSHLNSKVPLIVWVSVGIIAYLTVHTSNLLYLKEKPRGKAHFKVKPSNALLSQMICSYEQNNNLFNIPFQKIFHTGGNFAWHWLSISPCWYGSRNW